MLRTSAGESCFPCERPLVTCGQGQYTRTSSLKPSILLTTLSVCLLFFLRCGGAIENPHDYDVTDRLAWEALNASFEEHGVVLQSPDGAIPALIRRRATSLLQNRVYRLSLRVKALGESSGNLHADLYLGEHYDSPDQELVVQMQDPGSGSRRFERLLNSGRFNEVPFVRVFTFSQTPILVEEIALEEVR